MVLRASLVAVPALRRVEPVRSSGPVSMTMRWSAWGWGGGGAGGGGGGGGEEGGGGGGGGGGEGGAGEEGGERRCGMWDVGCGM